MRDNLLRKPENPQQATFLELFFDLAFVFVIERIALRVTERVADHGLAEGWMAIPAAGRTLLLLVPLTWVWTLGAWTTARFDPRRLPVQAVVIMSMFGVLIMSAALPTAFHGGALAFAGAYVVIQVGRSIVFVVILRGHERQPIYTRELVWFTLTGLLWIAGALINGKAQVVLWAAAAAGDYLAARLGWPVPKLGPRRAAVWAEAGEHLADRYRQFLLIALGESVLALATAYTMGLYDVESTAAFVIGFATTVLLWRIYFYRAGQILADAIAASKNPARLGRVAAFTHWIMILGIILTAIGYDLVIAHPLGHTKLAWLVFILGGPALYVAGRAHFEHVVFARVSRPRIIGAIILVLAAPLMHLLPPVLVALTTALILTGIAATDATRARGKPLEAPSPPS
ncbi:Low temperature requirement protein LtrA [Micromonospora viridifaciens]|uniref:Low temperature requirement protein LtrA n=1 Tax=Micromonospora viridifaciens TaxID=1881 RepID=A0A1C4Y7R4_MICVI|nr:low temperature requirement protein A [Micromonospora viridifaciens]SCF16754.1 Low temperature requirement protein LtrA [Micromonospora viridifaciens]